MELSGKRLEQPAVLRYYDMTCVPKNGPAVKAVGRSETMGEKKILIGMTGFFFNECGQDGKKFRWLFN